MLETSIKIREEPLFRRRPSGEGPEEKLSAQAEAKIKACRDFVKRKSAQDLQPEHDEFLSGGNLHGESTAMFLDFLAIAASELANISERRTYQLLAGRRGLPDFLVMHSGLNSGFMVSQYTSAALVNENKVLSTPACVDSIPTCQLQQDHVSMGGTSAYKLCQIVENCQYVLGIELLMALQAIDFNDGLELSPFTRQIYEDFRQRIGSLQQDRVMSPDLEAARDYVVEKAQGWVKDLE